MQRLLFLGLVLAVAACSNGQDPSDAGATAGDASEIADANELRDGAAADANELRDAAALDGEPADANELRDAGPDDANELRDAAPLDGEPADANELRDAEPADANELRDAEPADANELRDAEPEDATAGDAGAPFDGGLTMPDPAMSFFTTSAGSGANGGNYGGLAGADAFCQGLADAVGAGGRTWQAYLGLSDYFPPGVILHPKDRIGPGPWFNYYGVQIAADVAALHMNGLDANLNFTELGDFVPQVDHDIMTGSDENGDTRNDTCANWTDGTDNSTGFVGHSDWNLPTTIGTPSWNSSHRALGCSAMTLLSTAGSGRVYCFAIN